MKKLLSIILVSLVLLSSCANGMGSGDVTTTAPPETNETSESTDISETAEIEMKPTNGIVITNKCPEKFPNDSKSEVQSPADIKYILAYKGGIGSPSEEDYKAIRATLACEKNIEYLITDNYSHSSDKENSYKKESMISGIIDNEEEFKSYFEAYVGTDVQTCTVKYGDLFPDKFFEDNIILYSMFDDYYGGFFVGFEYGFDPSSKTLKIELASLPHEGWQDCTLEFGGLIIYLVTIPKADITMDGEIVPYEDINIEYSGYLDK